MYSIVIEHLYRLYAIVGYYKMIDIIHCDILVYPCCYLFYIYVVVCVP